ncbi:hypothetical protein C8Q78DRAFT_1070706 [Trametes maxima]|nr:hypothetical protein C8Q78DRAFT_1070706 [Trametes maxima]
MPLKTPEETSRNAEASAQYTKAINAEVSKDYDRAFRLYVKAAEQYLSLSRHTPDDRLRAQYRSQATKAMERAEKIKAAKQDVVLVLKDEFSNSEQLYVLQKSSLVNQGYFPLWESNERAESSAEQPPLSSEQQSHGAVWRRPNLDRYSVCMDGDDALNPQDIAQNTVSDCSVCGAVAVCIDHHRRFGSKMITSSLYPQDCSGMPCRSDTNQYQFRILYNGDYRRVSFDDQLPSYPDGTLMCMSAGGMRQLWPSLVEKAYMKLAGGYDFVGSALAGWIPEHIDMRSADFQMEKTWSRIARGYLVGDCVLTFGTGERLAQTSLPMQLLPAHCYAVIGVCNDDRRQLTIFDPWVRPQTGRSGEVAPTARTRTVEVSWEEVCNIFDGIYVSWNPALFQHQLTFHGSWPSACHFPGQLRLETGGKLPNDNVVWLHLSRHVRSHRSSGEYISLSAQSGSGVSSSFARDVLSTKGQYSNASHALIRVSLSAGELLTYIASYEGERDDVGFTLTAYSHVKASWVQSPAKPMHTKDVEGAFTHKSAGGNHTYPSYYLNPQYHLRVHPRLGQTPRDARDAKAHISLSLTSDRHIPVNLTLAWSRGERINEQVLGHNDLALSSGPYNHGYALASGQVPRHVLAGDYTLVVSAFEPRHIGRFDLRMESSDKFEITPILQEGAGMFSKVVKGEWTRANAAGGPSFGNYAANPTYEINVPVTSQLKFRLQLVRPTPTASLNLTMFNTSAGATSGAHIATSGPYSDAISGVVIPLTTFQPGRYIAIASTYNPGVLAGFVLIVYSTVSVQVTPVMPRR